CAYQWMSDHADELDDREARDREQRSAEDRVTPTPSMRPTTRRRAVQRVAGMVAGMIAVTAVTACSGSTRPTGTVRATASLAGAARRLPPDFFGANGANFIRDTDPNDARFLASVRALAPESIRVFAGTVANYWNWRTGGFVSGVPLPKDLATLSPPGMTLDRW